MEFFPHPCFPCSHSSDAAMITHGQYSFLILPPTHPSPTKLFYLFIYGCSGSSLLPEGFRCCGAWASHCGTFSCGAWTLEHSDFSSCHTQASCPKVCGILVLWPGIEPVFPALAGGFLTTGPPGKFLLKYFEGHTRHVGHVVGGTVMFLWVRFWRTPGLSW